MVRSVKLSQSVFDKETETVGVKSIHAAAPVLPPTQFPQLSTNAPPPKSLLQSVHAIVSVIDCESIWPSSDVIVDVKVKAEGLGFVNNPSSKVS